MMKNNYLVQLNHRQTVDLIGNKAKNLGLLQQLRCKVPNTFICTMDAYEAYQRDDLRLVSILRQELQQKLDPNKVYACVPPLTWKMNGNILLPDSSRLISGKAASIRFFLQFGQLGLHASLMQLRCICRRRHQPMSV